MATESYTTSQDVIPSVPCCRAAVLNGFTARHALCDKASLWSLLTSAPGCSSVRRCTARHGGRPTRPAHAHIRRWPGCSPSASSRFVRFFR